MLVEDENFYFKIESIQKANLMDNTIKILRTFSKIGGIKKDFAFINISLSSKNILVYEVSKVKERFLSTL